MKIHAVQPRENLFRLESELQLSSRFSNPLILRLRGDKKQWLLYPTLEPNVDTEHIFHGVLPPEISRLLDRLLLVVRILDALQSSRTERYSDIDLLYNIYDYAFSTEQHEIDIPEGWSLTECYRQWESENFQLPCLITGYAIYCEPEVHLSFFETSLKLNNYPATRQESIYFLRMKSAAIQYNNIVTLLYKNNFFLFPAFFIQPNIHICELDFEIKTRAIDL